MATLNAVIVDPDGTVRKTQIESELGAFQAVVGGYIEAVALPGGRYMVINENGKDAPHVINQTATDIAREALAIQSDDYIAGVAAIITQGILQ